MEHYFHSCPPSSTSAIVIVEAVASPLVSALWTVRLSGVSKAVIIRWPTHVDPILIGDAAAFLCCKTKQNQWYIELLFQLVCFLLIFDAKFKADFVLTFFRQSIYIIGRSTCISSRTSKCRSSGSSSGWDVTLATSIYGYFFLNLLPIRYHVPNVPPKSQYPLHCLYAWLLLQSNDRNQ